VVGQIAQLLGGASTPVIALVAAIAAVEVALLAWALADLARRPSAAVVGERKLVWLLLCVLLQIVGPIVYLAAGRAKTGPVAVPAETDAGVADLPMRAARLFGPSASRSVAGSSARAAVELVGVAKHFGEAVALDGLSMTVPEGTVYGFLGPNGAGKTTTLRILAGLSFPDVGTVRVLGWDLASRPAELRAQIGYLPDVPAFYKWMTAADYLRFAGGLCALREPALTARVDELAELAGLSGVTARIGSYSRGMRQRLGVAQALVNEPRLLLLDEPTSALDPLGRRDMLDMVAAIRGRTTILFSTHILADVERVCDTAAIIDRGHVVAEASVAELRRRRGGLQRLVVDVDDAQRLLPALRGRAWLRGADTAADGSLRLSTDDLQAAQHDLPAVIAEAGLSLRRLQTDELSLEDVFVSLVNGEGS